MEQKEINIELKIADRPLIIKTVPSQQEKLDKVEQLINNKIAELKMQYNTDDRQEYLAMALISIGLESISQQEEIEKTQRLLDTLNQKLNLFFDDSKGSAA